MGGWEPGRVREAGKALPLLRPGYVCASATCMSGSRPNEPPGCRCASRGRGREKSSFARKTKIFRTLVVALPPIGLQLVYKRFLSAGFLCFGQWPSKRQAQDQPSTVCFPRAWRLKAKTLHVLGISPMGQWLRLCAPNIGGWGSIPGQRTRSRVPQRKIRY